ncbi:variant erythrocyte surface antigen-1 family protein [Babesia caballi]|uniref:Variant erythrocyte surface antigen-1 family protein n=1 Tax=Babesia caballi TaxID=5871 RepID=A0AAV4LRE9_BABCB|nr:variant erythrocyte surface antigen-1 family protein [Babesia caballi]
MLTSPFDCPSNLKEAMGWILMVSGKDGQRGNDNTPAPAKAVKGLLQSVLVEINGMRGNYRVNGHEIDKLKKELEKAVEWVEKDVAGDTMFEYSGTPGSIGVLSSALARFIGYGSKGILSDPPTAGKLTGAGIAPSNIATHRLCDATVAFTIGVLEGCKKYSNLSKRENQAYVNKVNDAINTLYGKYGSGTAGLQEVAGSVQNDLNQVKGSNVGSFVRDIGTAFAKLKGVSDTANDVAGEVETYLKGVFKGSGNWTGGKGDTIANKLQQLGAALQQNNNAYEPHDNDVKPKISEVNTTLGTIKASNAVVKPILEAGKKAFISQLQKGNYTPTNYEKTVLQNTINVTHAKIFLSCLPLIFNNLSYFYWQCRDGGAWKNQNLTGAPLSPFMEGHWFFNSGMNENMTGTSVVRNVMDAKFPELQTAANAVSQKSYSDFLKNFKSRGLNSWQTTQSPVTTSNYLCGIYILCSCYFQCQQIKNAKEAFRTPQIIREMLYFLAALQFSPQYDEYDSYVTPYFKGIVPNSQSKNDFYLTLQVADSGSSKTNNTLSAADLKSHLLSTCIFIPGALGVIQGPGASEKPDEPWLFELFCNSSFNFKYPSGAALFSKVSNYTYALQFQVLFLYLMCNTYVDKCGWNNCTYGREVKPNGSGETLASHICPGLKCNTSNCNHKQRGNNCKHNIYDQTGGCGKGSNNSPLQAFLTDGIQGMCRQHPGTSDHLASCSSNSMCHVPMGFKAEHLRQKAVTGNHILTILNRFCGGSDTPLRQLLLGDLFGFTWHLNSQVSKSFGDITNAEWRKDLVKHTPFSNNLIKDRGDKLKALVGTNHQAHNSSAADLTALHSSRCDKPDKTCGPYLYPFTVSNGATFGKPPSYASVYLSWMVYLTEYFHEWFQEMLDEFKNIDCSKTGCLRKSTTGSSTCQQNHANGTHGTSSGTCSCDSVVHCGGVLPVLYRHGFQFYSPHTLSGGSKGDDQTKRNCHKFHSALSNVLAEGAPLTKLLETIDDFLFVFRFYFLYNQSAFWTIYVCIILYTLFFLLDTLHVRSHLKLTASHVVPPLALLTAGKARALTKLTYYLP